MNASSIDKSPEHAWSVGRTAIILFVLWAVSFGLSYVHLGWASLPVALVIAASKAVLVALFFMELVHARPSIVVTVLVALVLAAILVGLTVADVITR